MGYLTEAIIAVALWLLSIWMINKWYHRQDTTFIMSLPVVIILIAILGPLGMWVSSSVAMAVGLMRLTQKIQTTQINLDSSSGGEFNRKAIDVFNRVNLALGGLQRWAFSLGK